MDPTDEPATLEITVGRAAELFKVTEKTVRSWIRAGLPVVKAGGKGKGNGAVIDLAELIPWYLEENALDVAKTRLATAQAEKHEMENEVTRGDQLTRADVVAAWSDHIVTAKQKLRSIPTKLAPQLTNVANPNVIASRILAEVDTAIDELAWQPGAGSSGAGEDGVEEPAETHRKRVGGRKAKAQQRIVS